MVQNISERPSSSEKVRFFSQSTPRETFSSRTCTETIYIPLLQKSYWKRFLGAYFKDTDCQKRNHELFEVTLVSYNDKYFTITLFYVQNDTNLRIGWQYISVACLLFPSTMKRQESISLTLLTQVSIQCGD